MRTIITRTIEGKEVVTGFGFPVIDPVQTARLARDNGGKVEEVVYFQPRAGEEVISNEEAARMEEKFYALDRSLVLLRTGETVSRLEVLTDEERETEKQEALDAALNKSVHMRQRLEVQGNPEALAIAQQEYQAEVEAIENRFSKG